MYTFTPIALSILFGLIWGVLIGIISYRLPLGISLFRRPFCASCSYTLGVFDVLPVISFLILSGKCRYCKAIIPFRYFIIELTAAALFAANYFVHPGDLHQLLLVDLVTVILLTIVVSDLESITLSDNILLFLAGLGVLYAYLTGDGVLSLLILPIANFVVVLLLYLLLKAFSGTEAMVKGDLKLLFISGLFLSVENIAAFYIMIGIFGFLIGLHWRERHIGSAYPFGPAICISLYFCTLFGKSLDLTLLQLF